MIEFILNNKTIKTSVHQGEPLVDFLREYRNLKGTKIGCREGDCGACTILIGELHDDNVIYHSITSCISPLGNVHGKHVVTVEGISLENGLNRVQEEMISNNGTQCGFCTPGFVVSLTGFAIKKTQHNHNPLNTFQDVISGNICRCTGYKSIEKAGEIINNSLKGFSIKNSINDLIQHQFLPSYFATIPEKLKNIPKKENPKKGKIVASGSDLYVQQADHLRKKDVHLITLNKEHQTIQQKEKTCFIGANTTVSHLLENSIFLKQIPKLPEFLKKVSSEQIRNMGTLGGNFVNASPIGDLSVFFLALNAVLHIKNPHGNLREVHLKDFYKGYKTYDLKENEIIETVSFKILEKNASFNFEKVSKRTHLDIASVNSAMQIEIIENQITNIHLSIGGVAPIPFYAKNTVSFLNQNELNEENIEKSLEILNDEIAPISDIRGTSAYKRLLAKQLVKAHFITLFPNLF
ncbi:FAD binding domain-containing protein [Aureivirga marina]|uniref:FAD binding domain-containing protein n=1 Tax=Aureivirga marina TaxID=1182451 RepID=UPI0018C95496|nr:FAD binding domain-containing protein [Aureivirga marina]